MRISLIHPSRGRAEKAFRTLNYWLNQQSGKNEIEHILAVDLSDIQATEYQQLFKRKSFKINFSDNDCVVQAANNAAKLSTGDILIYLSDDFKCPPQWDELIIERIAGVEKCLLRVNDGYQPMENCVLTIPIMTRELYEHLTYFFYPKYRSMWADTDLFFTCLPYIVTEKDLVFPHEHPVTGKCETDETYQRSNLNFETGRALYLQRAAQFNWPNSPFKIMP